MLEPRRPATGPRKPQSPKTKSAVGVLGGVPGKSVPPGGLLGMVLGGHFPWKNLETALLPVAPLALPLSLHSLCHFWGIVGPVAGHLASKSNDSRGRSKPAHHIHGFVSPAQDSRAVLALPTSTETQT